MKEHLNRHESVRGWFAYELHEHMSKNEDIWVVTADLGYKMLDRIRDDYPDRFVNVGAAEQAGMGVSVGLAMEGKIPFFYSITPFALYRPFETIRNYVNREKIPVKIVGAGQNRDYKEDGWSHWAEEDRNVMGIFNNINAHWIRDKQAIPGVLKEAIETPEPFYLNLKR